MLGKQGEIASEMGIVVTNKWIDTSRFRETLHLCKSTLNAVESYKILTNLARSEQELGEIEQAQQHYQQALELCPATDEKEKSAYMNYFMYVIKEHDLVLPLLKKIRGKTLMLQ